jgi:hypothetical protein
MIAALATGAALALTGCEQHPYPTPAPDDSAAPPPPSQLMGAPNTPDGQPPMGPPNGLQPPPPPGYAGSPPGAPTPYSQGAPAHSPCPPDASQQGPNAPTVIICSTPVPNPVEDQAYPPHHRHPDRSYFSHRYEQGYSQTAPAPHAPYPHHHRHYWGRTVGRSPRVEQGQSSKYVIHNGHRYRIEGPAHPNAARPGAAVISPHHPAIVEPVSPELKPRPTHHIKPKPLPALNPTQARHSDKVSNTTASQPAGSNTAGGATGAAGTPAERYAALQSALAEVMAREATLTAPAHFEPGQAADVTLTVPSDFAQTLRQEAAKQDLSDQTASVNLTSALAGDGYTVTPAEPEAQPLTLGQQTVFHWKVTARTDAKGPLQASLNADILSDGQSLPLGPVKVAGTQRWTARLVGVGLLALIALILLAWAAQRKGPAAKVASKPRQPQETGV